MPLVSLKSAPPPASRPLSQMRLQRGEENVSGTVVVDFGSATGVDGDFQVQSFDHFITPGVRTERRTALDTVS